MEIGFNKFPIIATALNSDNQEDRYPIVHAVLRKNEDEKYFIEFQIFSTESDEEKVETFRSELMVLIKEETNLELPYLINGSYYKIVNGMLGSKYFRMPLGKII
jgi:hypothetical protein